MSTVRYAFHIKRAARGAPKQIVAGAQAAPPPAGVPQTARLLALAHRFQSMLDRGEVPSMADLARLGRVSRARITQIMDLLLLAPEIQEGVLFGAVGSGFRELLSSLTTLSGVGSVARWRQNNAPLRIHERGDQYEAEPRRSERRALS